MNRTNRKAYILEQLSQRAATAAWLADMLECPEASVRQNIQALRADGHYIIPTTAGTGEYRVYPSMYRWVNRVLKGASHVVASAH